jgi:hypothetical protein
LFNQKTKFWIIVDHISKSQLFTHNAISLGIITRSRFRPSPCKMRGICEIEISPDYPWWW